MYVRVDPLPVASQHFPRHTCIACKTCPFSVRRHWEILAHCYTYVTSGERIKLWFWVELLCKLSVFTSAIGLGLFNLITQAHWGRPYGENGTCHLLAVALKLMKLTGYYICVT